MTLDRVISEVKDERSREYILNRLPYELEVKTAESYLDKEDLDKVQNFAKDTGDFKSLSKVDMMVIALGCKTARLRGEDHLVHREPKDLGEFRPERLKAAYDAYSDHDTESSDEDGSDEAKNQDEVDEWGSVGISR